MRWFLFLFPFLLVGCAQQESAEDLLGDYLQLSDAGSIESFDELLTGAALSSAVQANELIQDLELQQVGETSFHSFENLGSGEFGFCLDVSKTRLIDPAGNDLTPEERPLQVPMKMKIESFANGSRISELDIRRFSRC
ncbi:MAG TPA: hypothetical protein VIB61_04375 [Microbacteriaceae bacterium]